MQRQEKQGKKNEQKKLIMLPQAYPIKITPKPPRLIRPMRRNTPHPIYPDRASRWYTGVFARKKRGGGGGYGGGGVGGQNTERLDRQRLVPAQNTPTIIPPYLTVISHPLLAGSLWLN